ncbi:MAG TPA: PQQ-dependent sugar dehydrogenase, partial [Candidatus Methylomirabilis sp.]
MPGHEAVVPTGSGFRWGAQAGAALALLGLLFLLPDRAAGAPAPPSLALDNVRISLEPVVSGLARPLGIVPAGDGSGRLFIVEQGGRIRIYDSTGLRPTPFLDVQSLITSAGAEQGLLGLAFHPTYATNRRFFVYYTNTAGNIVIAQYLRSADPNVADSTSATVVLTIPHPNHTNHNGGQLQFGPDGFLYVAVGDGGGGGDPDDNAQNLGSLLGKLLRLDVDAGPPYIPAGNPFGNSLVWALGLRNPWRFSFDR